MGNKSDESFSWEKMKKLLDDTLEEKLEMTLETTLETKLQDVVRKQDIHELIHKLETVEKENALLKKELKLLSARLERIDRKSRSSNVVVNGLLCPDVDAAKSKFRELCSDVLKVNAPCTTAVKLAQNTFMFSLDSTTAVQTVMSAKAKLRDRPIYIQKDYTPYEQNVRYNLRMLNKKIRDKNKNIKTKLGDFHIIINDKKLAWSNENFIAFTQEDLKYFIEMFKKFDFNFKVIISNNQQSKRNVN